MTGLTAALGQFVAGLDYGRIPEAALPLVRDAFTDTVAIYFHCAVAGHKLENIAANSRVSFCVVGKTEVLSDQFATHYQSVIVFGQAEEVFDEEKHLALEGVLAKYSPGYREKGCGILLRKADELACSGSASPRSAVRRGAEGSRL